MAVSSFLVYNLLTGIEVVPARLFGEVDGAVACLVVAHGTCHQGRTEHPLVLDIVDVTVAIEVHHETAHHGIVLGMCASHLPSESL